MFPGRLQAGDEIRVVAPSTSLALVKDKQVEIAAERLSSLGFTVTYGKNAYVHDEFFSSSIEERLEDLHDAFKDQNVKAVLTATGGYNCNQLLKKIDYELIQANPKIFCGFGDITALNLAIYKKTGLITYCGPCFSSFGMKEGFDYTLQSFLDAVTNDSPFEIEVSPQWSDDHWFVEHENRVVNKQTHYQVIQEGTAEGRVIGGNLSTINLLQGTEFRPALKDTILFIEDNLESHPHLFERDLQSLLHLPDAKEIKGLLIGRFQKASNMTESALAQIICSKPELKNIPVIANVNFGHVHPFATIPIGALATVRAKGNKTEIKIEQV